MELVLGNNGYYKHCLIWGIIYMLTDLKMNFEKFLNHSSDNFMFVDGYTGIGKTSIAKETIREFNNLHVGETSVLLTQAPYINSERQFIISLLREEKAILFYKNMHIVDLKTLLLKKLSICKCLVIDDSQNILSSRRHLKNHFLLMSWLVDETNIKVLYLGTSPFEQRLLEDFGIYKRSVVYNLKAS